MNAETTSFSCPRGAFKTNFLSVEGLLGRLKGWLERRELRLNEQKTRLVDIRQEGIKFLGLALTWRQSRQGRGWGIITDGAFRAKLTVENMELQELRSELWLSKPRMDVFPFFANASNLQALTPEWLDFAILTSTPITIQAGTRIDYRLRVRGVPLYWQSEIMVWEPPHRFVDEQRRGPYRFWMHEHLFEERKGGTTVIDYVRYAVWGGRWINRLFVRRDLEAIFAFRRQKLIVLFGVEK